MLSKAYDPGSVEDRIYAMWEKSGAFRADATSGKPPFTISMPPPNATGQLHLGHAVMLALQDILIRFHRMLGDEALWVPGTDHAAIATENVVLKLLRAEGVKDPRAELGREGLLSRIAAYVEKSKDTIRGQIRKMGSSCDWSRERYTFEPALNRLVNEVFASMYEDGLIYRGHRIVNWDPKLQTTVSDDEIVWIEEVSPFYTFQYGPFRISTSRPETKFGDKYVVMHPDDKRYAAYKHGQTIELEWINGPIRATVIKDAAVDPTFGTGCMTITPWHDAVDFAIAERHGLEKEQIIGFDGRLLPIAGEFAGMAIDAARPLIVEKLKGKGLLAAVDGHYVHRKATAQRGGGTIEPQIKLQWFIDVHKKAVSWKGESMSLKEIMHEVIHHGDIAIVPDSFSKTYFHWIDNLRDWCISRQIWWGHRVPVWYRGDETFVGSTAPAGKGWEQDPDTLDTWFSSALWTWSTLVDPALAADPKRTLRDMLLQSPDVRKFHPTSVMETGYDILFFWVARMILMTTYVFSKLPEVPHEQKVPFRTVYLHGLVRTREGKKMSKSDPTTMIDPLDMIATYGADALRLAMIVGQSPGNDTKLYEEKIAGYRNFVNKLWNASRFVLMKCEEMKIDPQVMEDGRWKTEEVAMADRAILHAAEKLTEDITMSLQEYRLSDAGERLYAFVWDTFCDWYLELSKGTANPAVLVHVLRRILRLLHPYCPFVTEELWAQLKPADAGVLMRESWPAAKKERMDQAAYDQLQTVIDVITAIRRIRAEQGIEAGKKIDAVIHSKKHATLLEQHRDHIVRMAKVGDLTIDEKPAAHANAASAFLPEVEIHVPLDGLVDPAAMKKELQELQAYVASLEAKLGNAGFTAKAPASVVGEMRTKLAEAREKLGKIGERLSGLR
ncbi:MAG: valyl-tRNA synthetase [Candidatus Peregrinibacteria bacterium Gr01-1014_25]|nr:MAG: valyl-tRNA synthetase [Candidatus Peregrinibacteria bacterium Gr01-1014_25]